MEQQDHNINLSAKEQGRVLKRLLAYTSPHKRMIILAFIMLAISTACMMASPFLVKIFIDQYLTQDHFPPNEITLLIGIFILAEIGGAVTAYLQTYYFEYLALKVIQQLRIDAFSKIGRLGMRYFDKVPGGSVVSRLTNDTEAIVDMFIYVFSTAITAVFMVIASYTMMFVLDVKLAFISLIFIPIIILTLAIYRKYASIYFSEARHRLSMLNAKLAESIEGMKIIQAFNQEKRLHRAFERTNDEHYGFNMKTIRLDGLLLRPAISLISIISMVLILGYYGVFSFNHVITAGLVYAFLQYMQNFIEPINQVSQNLSILQRALVAGSRVFKLIDDDTLEPKQKPNPDYAITDGVIEFKNVTFSYDGSRDVLRNISFKVNQGETVALVGHTGSGKSSIVNLFMRFYEFDQGDITIDGHSIKAIPKQELKRRIGLVLQDAFIFYGTVASNIKLYHPKMTFQQVKAAAEFVQADKFIEALPGQYDFKVVEKGAAFSSGERQLLAFARTMAMDPKILILDEATANIDSETEEQIQLALDKMRRGRTTIAIAHRLSTIQNADHILVLNRGEIVERGNHESLIKQGGIYHKMYLLQNG
ncbi:ABC transporter ATP-binding protein [Staphylococcus massiliensis]|uniref:ABC transporter ATP-binding protein n=1 Tax=Staphylococcus massiliensis TaxID=555791 RepID=UPI00031D20C4|nr:ABC transporter ATP-binding protein [Staphylococcus massiliensis]MCG3399175.1 ABC transporter ATP-binding protein/permease [Staphylococcus massiliensis]PNZ99645.1 ABC transporter ATP-binding protein [Staphylococcus massiliensis CCUG 55927]